MEKFVVSARKYRPAVFDTVVGQSHITTTLKNAIRTNHLAQAFLFCGPRGVGKTTCARILAKTINCQNLGDDTEACDTCESCRSFNHNASFNIHELDAASNNSVDDIRNLIDQVRFPPQAGKYKIYIIDEVHMLSTAAFNAFLKTLEEPPSYAIFILATTEKHKILPTILSRCQIFDFNRIQIQDIAGHLADIAQKENIEADHEALELIAQKADGGLRDALSMFDLNVTFAANNRLTYAEVLENLHILDYDYYFKMVDALFAGSLPASLLIYDEILEKGFDGHQFVVGLCEHLRNVMVCKDAVTVKLLKVSESVQKKYLEQAKNIPLPFLLSALSVGSNLDTNYKTSKNQRLHVEIGLMKMSQIPNVLNLSKLPENGDEKKKPSRDVALESPQPLVVSEEPAKYQTTAPTSNIEMGGTPLGGTPHRTSKFNLRSTLDIEAVPQKPIAQTKAVENFEAVQNQPFTKEALEKYWLEFAENREKESEKVLLKRVFDLRGNTIFLQVDNDTQLQYLNELRQDLMTFLRKSLQNATIQLEAEVIQNETERRPYTQQEKFDCLAKKNPALLELREVLMLDVNY